MSNATRKSGRTSHRLPLSFIRRMEAAIATVIALSPTERRQLRRRLRMA